MHTGTCLCGAVRIRVEGEFEHAPEICHCVQCRKQTGHVLAGVNVRKARLTIEGERDEGDYCKITDGLPRHDRF